MLKQIQRHLLASQQNVSESARARDNFAGFDLLTISSERFQLQLRIERGKNFLSRFQPRDYHFFRRDEPSLRPRVAGQHALRRDVPAAEILAQEESDARIERAFIEPVQQELPSGTRRSWVKQTCRRDEISIETVVIDSFVAVSEARCWHLVSLSAQYVCILDL